MLTAKELLGRAQTLEPQLVEWRRTSLATAASTTGTASRMARYTARSPRPNGT